MFILLFEPIDIIPKWMVWLIIYPLGIILSPIGLLLIIKNKYISCKNNSMSDTAIIMFPGTYIGFIICILLIALYVLILKLLGKKYN